MIYIIGLDGVVRGILSNDIPNGVPYWDDMNEMSVTDGMDIFEFKVPAGNDTSAKIEVEHYVAIADYDNVLKLFKVREIQTIHDREGFLYNHVYAESAALELLKIPVRPTTFEAQTPDAMLQSILVPTLWRVGTVEINNIMDFAINDYMNTIEAILAIVNQVGGEVRYRVEIQNGRIVGRYIDLLERYGRVTEKRFTFGKDVTEIVRYEDNSQIFTAVIPIGINDPNTDLPITIESVERTYTNANGTVIEKPMGQDYIGDPDALAIWSDDGQHLTAVLKLDEEAPQVLAAHGWEFLKNHTQPKMEYDVKVITLAELSNGEYNHEAVRVGDTVIVEDLMFEKPLVLEARVLNHGRSKSDPSKDFVKLGNFVEQEINTEDRIERLRDTIRAKQLQWDEGGGETIIKQNVAPTNPTADMLWVDTSSPNLHVWKMFNFDTGLWVPITPTQAAEIGAATPEYVDRQVTDLHVVRRNLLEGTRNWAGWDEVYNNPVLDESMEYNGAIPLKVNAAWGYRGRYYTFEEGKTYTISAWLRTDTAGMSAGFYAFTEDHVMTNIPANTWIRFSATFTTAAGTNHVPGSHLIRIESGETSATQTLWVAGIKLEEGTGNTEWTRHVDDNSAELDQVINRVTGTESKVTEIEQSVTDSSIRNVVLQSTEFDMAMSEKANASDLGDLATSQSVDAVSNSLAELQLEIDAINFADFALLSDVEQTAQSLTAKFSATGGVNLIRNSVGFSELDFWTVTGTGIGTTQSEELERLGLMAGFVINAGTGTRTLSQITQVIPNTEYTLSLFVKKPEAVGVFTVTITDNDTGVVLGTVDGTSSTHAEFDKLTKTFVPSNATIKIELSADSAAEVEFSGLMLNLGDVAFGWTTASGEVYNTNVKMDLNGIRVYQLESGVETNFTMITPQKFAGYYDVNGDGVIDTSTGSIDEVFRMDKDEFKMKKATVEDEITMGGIKIIKINSTGSKGWAFVGT